MPLSQDDIAAAGLALLNEVGLDGLTTRKLAVALSIQGPALYHHFSNKQELLGHMANMVVARAVENTTGFEDWTQWLRSIATNIRLAVLSYRDGARLLTAGNPDEGMRMHTIPTLIQPLLDAGFTRTGAGETVMMISSLTIGWIMNEQNPGVQALMRVTMETGDAWDRCLGTVIDGLRLRLGTASI